MKIQTETIAVNHFKIIYVLSIISMFNQNFFNASILNNVYYLYCLVLLPSLLYLILNGSYFNNIVSASLGMFLLFIPSVIFSFSIDVSSVKLLLFLICFYSSIAPFILLKPNQQIIKRLILWSSFFNRSIVIFSIPLIFTSIGYPANETGFGGVLNHPQAFGVYLISSVTLELALMRIIKENPTSNIIFIGLMLLMTFLTESRLAIFTILTMLIVSNITNFKLSYKKIILILLAITIIIFKFDFISEKFTYVVSKSGRSNTSIVAALEHSRGRLVEASIINFSENPLYGIGFQVSNGKHGSYPMEVDREDTFNIPLKARVEKGVFWSALLEETGMLGLIGFSLFLWFLFFESLIFTKFLALTALILAGFGESFYFSFGGVGGFFWLIIFLLSSVTAQK